MINPSSFVVGERENKRVRVFTMAPDAGFDDPIFQFQRAIGVPVMNKEDIQRVEIAELGEMTLVEFLEAGYDPYPDSFDLVRDQLSALTGVVFVVRSSAFPDRPITLKTDGSAQLVAIFSEHSSAVSFEPLPDAGSRGSVDDAPQKKTPSDAAMGGRVATVALLVMALLVWLMIWIAG